MTITWQTSETLSCFHAADVWLRTRSLADPELAAELGPAAEQLEAGLEGELVPPDSFWSHLLPLAASFPGTRQLAEVALTKSMGREEGAKRIAVVHGLLTDMKNAYQAAMEQRNAAVNVEPLRILWRKTGQPILTVIESLTEPGVLVEEAQVVGVYPARGGLGVGQLAYNLVHIEIVPADPVPELPEAVRLAWLISTLNLDLPRYSENLRRKNRNLVALLAMMPVTLAATAAVNRHPPVSEERLDLAIRSWLYPAPAVLPTGAVLMDWWSTYQSMRPGWVTALGGLDKLLA